MKQTTRKEFRDKRHARIRRKINGTAERPRMAIMVSNRNIYVQFVDDEKGVTLASVSTLKPDGDKKINVDTARDLGKRVAEVAGGKGIKNVVVDRGGFKFHGRIKALVDASVAAGLVISEKPSKQVAEQPDGQ